MEIIRNNKVYYKYEILNGKTIYLMPARPAHVNVVSNIHFIFNLYFRDNDMDCKAYPDGMTLYIDKNNKPVPDVMIICDKTKITDKVYEGVPEIVVEVLSDSTAKNDRTDKMNVYAKVGIKEYWLIDPEKKSVELYVLNDSKYELIDIYYENIDDVDEAEGIVLKDRFYTYTFKDFEIVLKDIFKL